MKRPVLLHAHIFKNAGTSFDYSLKESFGDAFIDHREDELLLQGKQKYLEVFLNENSHIKAFSSHSIHFFPEDTMHHQYFVVRFLRHPIDRIRSVYAFERQQQADSLGAIKAKILGFKEYVEWRMRDDVPATIRNCQTIFLSGQGPKANQLNQKFEAAKINLERGLVGITHEYDKSMTYFNEKLSPYFPELDLSYVRKNVTDSNPGEGIEDKVRVVREMLGEVLYQIVLEKNAFDLQLYELAKSKLNNTSWL